MMQFGKLSEAKPGDEIAGEFCGHLFVMKIDHMVYSTFDVDDAVETEIKHWGLTEPELFLNTEENGMGKWRFSAVNGRTVLVFGRRLELGLGLNNETSYGYMNTNMPVMIHTPDK